MSENKGSNHKQPKEESKQQLYKHYVENITEDDYIPKHHFNFSTKAIHVGQAPEKTYGCVNVPIYLSTTYAQKEPGVPYGKYDYTRCGNPTRAAYEECIAALEYGTHAIAFASGLAATTCIMHILDNGSHIICSDDVYGGTQRYMRKYAIDKHKYQIDFVDMTNLSQLEKAVKPETKMVWIETPTNPTLKITDIQAASSVIKKIAKDVIICVDNTFATSYLQSPLQLGADIVVHSVSKYIGGHSDIIMGTLVLKNEQLHAKLIHAANSFGGNPSIFDCYLALRGLKTLELRMKQHCKNALAVAKFLEQNKLIEKVIYPGLKSHPQHDIAKKQMRGFGGMISFYIKGDREHAKQFLQNCHLATFAESLGGVETLIESPSLMTHASVPAEVRKELGIEDNFIRISVGVEEAEDIIEDLDKALHAAFKK